MLPLCKTLHDLIITSCIQPDLLSAHVTHTQRIKTLFFLGLRRDRHKCVRHRIKLSYTDLGPFQLFKPVNRNTSGRLVYFKILFVIYTTQAKRRCCDYSGLNWKGFERRWSRPRRCHFDIRLQGLYRTMKNVSRSARFEP